MSDMRDGLNLLKRPPQAQAGEARVMAKRRPIASPFMLVYVASLTRSVSTLKKLCRRHTQIGLLCA